MSKVLIGVGGSGQHIIHAYLRVLALGDANAVDVPHVYIIDADAQSTQSAERKSTLIPDIQDIHNYLSAKNKVENVTAARFEIIRPFSSDLAKNRDLTVRDVLFSQNKNTALEIKSFFYDEGDLDIKVSEGMHANPKVGSTIFGEKLGKVLDRNNRVDNKHPLIEEEFGSLFTNDITGSNAGSINIVIAGSVFGGTGSGIIPTLARTLNEILSNNSGNREIKITTVTTLPWFVLRAGEGGITGSASDVNKLKRNTSFALRNFREQLQNNPSNVVSSIFIQSAKGWDDIERPSAGDFDQPEHTHVINLLAANAVQHGFANDFKSAEMFVSTSDLEDELKSGRFHPHFSEHLHFFDYSRRKSESSLWMLLTKNLILSSILETFAKVLDTYNEGELRDELLDDLAMQHDSLYKFMEWLRDAKGIPLEEKSGGFLGFGKKTFIPNAIANKLSVPVNKELEQYRKTLKWFAKHYVTNDSESGVLANFKRYQAFTMTNNSEELWFDLVRDNNDTNFKSDEQWQSCAFKIINKTLVDDSKELKTDLVTKLDTINQLPLSDSEKNVLFVRSLINQIYASLDEYIKPAENFDTLHSVQLHKSAKLGNAKAISQVQIQMQQQKKAIDHYGTMQWSARLTGDEANLDDMDINHPDTLYWYDTLSSTKIVSNVINYTEVNERNAQGIPNILSNFLLQKWRLELEDPINVADHVRNSQQNRYYENKASELSSTKLGLYLYSQRVIEAAFWLLISGANDVIYTEVDLEGQTTPYKKWLSRELLTQNWAYKKLGIIATNDNSRTPLFVWNGYFWTLASNSTAQAYFSEILNSSNLPSMRYHYDTTFSRRQNPNISQITTKDKLFSTQLTYLKNRLDTNNPNEKILLTALTGILADLPIPNDNPVDVASINPPMELGCQAVVELHEIGTSNIIAKFSDYLLPKPKAILLDKEANEKDEVMKITQFVPVKKEYWLEASVREYLEKEGNSVHAQVRFIDRKDNTKCVWDYTNLYLPDLGYDEFSQSIDNNQYVLALGPYDFTFGVSIWPNFKVSGWTYYQLSIDILKSQGFKEFTVENLNKLYGSHDIKLTIYSEDLQKSVSFGFQAVPQRINFVPTVIELSIGEQVIGTRPINLESLDGNQVTAHSIGLDFGTSNTCMAITFNDNDELNPENLNLANTAEQPRLEWLIHSDGDSEQSKNQFMWSRSGYYLMRQAEVSRQESYTIPSELLLGLSLDTNYDGTAKEDIQLEYLRNNATQNIKVGGVDVKDPIFSPLCSDYIGFSANDEQRIELFNTLLASDSPPRIFSNIKWPGREGSNASERLRTTYIEQVLVGVYARLRKQGVTNIDYMYVTRPDAFLFENTAFASNYVQKVQSIANNLNELTGVTLNQSTILEVSETQASLNLSRLTNKQAYVVVDMGGGTTDIDICLAYNDDANHPAYKKYSSSIKWAGNDVIRALIRPKKSSVRMALANKCKEYSDVSKVDNTSDYYNTLLASILKLEIRNGIKIIDDVTNPEQVSKVVQMFYESIYEYIFVKMKLMLQESNIELGQINNKEIHIVLQGNGFKLSEYFSHPDHIHPSLHNGHFAQTVWDTVFNDEPEASDINLNVTYSENSKEEMIRKGASRSAEPLYDAMKNDQDLNVKNTVKLEKQKILYPAGIFDKNPNSKPMMTEYNKDESQPQLAHEYSHNEKLLPVLEELFPYTKKYWKATTKGITDVPYLFTSQSSYGHKRFMDINAMYLTGTGSATDDWNFFKAMTKRLVNA